MNRALDTAITQLYQLKSLDSGDANGLFDAIKSAFEEDALPWGKLVGYASDGENLMQGQKESLLKR